MFPPNFLSLTPADRTRWFYSCVRIASRRQLNAFARVCAQHHGEQPRNAKAWGKLNDKRMGRTLEHLVRDRELVEIPELSSGDVGANLVGPIVDTKDDTLASALEKAATIRDRWENHMGHHGLLHYVLPNQAAVFTPSPEKVKKRGRSEPVTCNQAVSAVFITLLAQSLATPKLICDWELLGNLMSITGKPHVWARYYLAREQINVSVDCPEHWDGLPAIRSYLRLFFEKADQDAVRWQLWLPEHGYVHPHKGE